MKKIPLYILTLIFAINWFAALGQPNPTVKNLWENYSQFKEETINHRRFQHEDIKPLILKLKKDKMYNVKQVGNSIEGRELYLISLGTGDIDVFLWSQMHGDESTATMAIFDIFNYFSSETFSQEKQAMLKRVKLHFLPMLNPDGAQVFQRRNALGIDVNRDALRLQSPEGKVLKRIRDSLEADFGFNLHDQSRYYNAETTARPATISFLAPAYNYEKDINEVRGDAMKLIVKMNRELQEFIPGQVAKYNDDFEPRAFGDNIQKWGTSAILIESGGYLNDPEKQEIRKLNFIAILSAIISIAQGDYKAENIEEYNSIPENDSKLFDLKLTGLQYSLLGENYILDLGINHQEIPKGDKGFYYRGSIADQGDLSTNYGYETRDFNGYNIVMGKLHPKTFENIQEIEKLNFTSVLSDGYAYIRVRDLSGQDNSSSFPVQIVNEDYKVPSRLNVGSNPTFFLEKNGKRGFAVINGFLVDLENVEKFAVKNSLIIK